jgi:hypothetical protein
MISQHHAPDTASRIQACQDAFRHRLALDLRDGDVTTLIDSVPRFVPGMGASGEWYRVGALHLLVTNQYLTVYLDAVTGHVQIEQALMDVDSSSRPAHQEGGRGRRAESPEQNRWDNEGGAT